MRSDNLESALAICRTSVIDDNVVSVEWPLLDPDWLLSSQLFSERKGDTQLKTIGSIVVPGQDVKLQHKLSVALITSTDEKRMWEGRGDDTKEKRQKGEREHRFNPNRTVQTLYTLNNKEYNQLLLGNSCYSKQKLTQE